ncbi:D-2-hydroxyglutarate dehydrogenase, mitochondrial-like [Dysidea avara]|uniref:D-2-hydroxyglutarate dehydrogenase, mitochondrial-like n=1 Tax=Dysidea avara TaxID=196820 RepID=UPI00332E4CD9
MKAFKSCIRLVSVLKRCRQYSTVEVPLTAEYYNVKRGNYATVTADDVTVFRDIVGSNILTEPDDVEPYNVDWMRNLRGQSSVVVKPKTTGQVSQILKHCSERNLAVVTQGGNTGLVGGSTPVFDEVVIALSSMNRVLSVDELSGILVCEAGCILESLSSMVMDKGFVMPLDLAAKGSCQIGGNAATNAGGIRLMRYGSLHGNILGMNVVLANGTILDLLSTMRKDNTGYDLKQLFIGSEGTLGIITELSILLPPKPKAENVAFMSCESFDKVQQICARSKAMIGEVLSALEFMDWQSVDLVTKHTELRNPLERSPFYVLIETAGSNNRHDEEKLNDFLEAAFNEGLIKDGLVATDLTKVNAVWGLRERLVEAQLKEGVVYKYDISLPLANFYEIVEMMRERVKHLALCTMGYGHIGDGNLHLNVVGDSHSLELLGLIEPFLFDWTAKHRGSISPEHGLGFKKSKYIYHSKSKEAVTLMEDIKKLFDPKGILNPYKTLPYTD